jgi:hypothetical protein
MGYAISWIAIKGLDRAEVYDRLDMKPTGEINNTHELNCARVLANGWIVVVLDKAGHPLVQEANLEELSLQAEVIACNTAENAMFSSAEAWTDGVRLWSVTHDATSGDVFDLEIQGNPPPILAAIDGKYRKLQKAEGEDPHVDHIFEVPLALATRITGFKHDEPAFQDFEMLEWAAAPMVKSWKPKQLKAWWQFWK